MERIKRKAAHCWKMFQKQRQLWLLCIPIIIWVVVFAYVPMYGLLIAFVDYIPGMNIFKCNFVGLKYDKPHVPAAFAQYAGDEHFGDHHRVRRTDSVRAVSE